MRRGKREKGLGERPRAPKAGCVGPPGVNLALDIPTKISKNNSRCIALLPRDYVKTGAKAISQLR
jgi:hypothetical protein